MTTAFRSSLQIYLLTSMNELSSPNLCRFSWLLLLSVFFVPIFGEAQTPGEAPPLPFRATRDGKVNFQDLLKLTKRAPGSDRITDEALEAIKQDNKIKYDSRFRATEEPLMPPRNDLYANSVLLSDGVNHTLLPNHSLIFVPDALKDHVVEKPKGELILWPDFLQRHRAWLLPQEVTLDTALGKKPLTPDFLKSIQLSRSIVVGVLRGSPISVLAPKEIPEAPGAESLPLTLNAEEPGSDPELAMTESPKELPAGAPSPASRFSRKEAATSLAKVQDEAEALAEKNAEAAQSEEADTTSGTAGSSRQGSTFKSRTASRFGRFAR